MIPSLTLVAVAALTAPQRLIEEARWIRHAAISPNGTHVAFSYAGDLWVVPTAADGDFAQAELLTTHVGYETSPVWSPDSRTIAFAADWYGQFDVFVTTLERAPARRLTYHSADDTPVTFAEGGFEVWFTSSRQDVVQARIGSAAMSELYAIRTDGGAPRQLLTTPAERANPNDNDSLVLYQDRKAYEDEWRKHHVSSHARDLWSWNRETGAHTKLTEYRGEDRDPVWLPNGQMAFLSERGGSFNIWVMPIGDEESAKPLTIHTVHPLRFLSAADDGTFAYIYDGELWVRPLDGESRRIPVIARVDVRQNAVARSDERNGATEMAVSPEGDEVAFVLRGEVFVASLEHGTTKRVTTTPEQERSVTWAADGRSLYYASERDGSWNLYRSSIRRDVEQRFSAATLLDEEAILADLDVEEFQPVVSPDGKQLAYLHDRESLRVLELEGGGTKEVVSPDWNYSYQDGDISYSWSPDSRWLTFTYSPYQRFSGEVGAVDVASGEIVNVSASGYDEGAPKFSPDGKVVVYPNGRFGQRQHSGRGGQSDLMGAYLTQAAYDQSLLDWENVALAKAAREQEEQRAKEQEEEHAAAAAGDEPVAEEAPDAAREDDTEEAEENEPIEFERDGLRDRKRRLTLQSAPMGDFVMTPDGEAVIYFAEVDGKWDLWTSHLRDRKTQRLLALGGTRGGDLHLSEDGKTLVIRSSDGRLQKASISTGKHDLPESAKAQPVGYAAELAVDGPAERRHLFEHVWRQVREKFYVESLHGVDWEGMKAAYASFLPHIHNGYDFAEMLSEMLGELNASHTGARHRPRADDRDDTASLGLIYGAVTATGLEVAEVLDGGPADRDDSALAAGVHITAIDGQPVDPNVNPWALLEGKAGKVVLLAIRTADGADLEEVIEPISGGAERELHYRRWIRRCEELVDELSGGRIGYVHVRGMNDGSYRDVYEQVLARCSDKEALVVDTRWNGGGWLHDQLVTFLGGEQYCQLVPRDKEPGRFGGEPLTRWSRPVCVVQNEGNYSDAHFFPYSFRTLGLGKLIGTPVAGTSTAVWWETMIDGTVFGIPQVGVMDTEGDYLENKELFPDIEVYNDPESTHAGRDRQLQRAVEEMLREVDGGGVGGGS